MSVTFDQGIFMATMIKFFEEKSEEAYEIIAMNETYLYVSEKGVCLQEPNTRIYSALLDRE